MRNVIIIGSVLSAIAVAAAFVLGHPYVGYAIGVPAAVLFAGLACALAITPRKQEEKQEEAKDEPRCTIDFVMGTVPWVKDKYIEIAVAVHNPSEQGNAVGMFDLVCKPTGTTRWRQGETEIGAFPEDLGGFVTGDQLPGRTTVPGVLLFEMHGIRFRTATLTLILQHGLAVQFPFDWSCVRVVGGG